MTVHIALLRGINVGGHKKVAMSGLRDFVAALGFDEVQTLLQTGNAVFNGGARTGVALEHLLETEAEKRLDLETTFIVRTLAEWKAVMVGNPFPDAAQRDPGHLVVMFLKDAPSASALKGLRDAHSGPELIRGVGKHLYVVYTAGIARSRFSNALVESKLGTRVTARNWNTVLKLAALAGG